MEIHTDVVIVGCGVAGLYSALKLPRDLKIVMITKSDAESSDSFLAQGGICVQRDEDDYDGYYDDILPADEGRFSEGLDKNLIKKVIGIIGTVLLIVALCVLMMYML